MTSDYLPPRVRVHSRPQNLEHRLLPDPLLAFEDQDEIELATRTTHPPNRDHQHFPSKGAIKRSVGGLTVVDQPLVKPVLAVPSESVEVVTDGTEDVIHTFEAKSVLHEAVARIKLEAPQDLLP